ncbi:hypothetical protein D3C81_1799140 [compost metagenome]
MDKQSCFEQLVDMIPVLIRQFAAIFGTVRLIFFTDNAQVIRSLLQAITFTYRNNFLLRGEFSGDQLFEEFVFIASEPFFQCLLLHKLKTDHIGCLLDCESGQW